MSDPTRVRYAPSPTGRQHVGGARTALFNWAWARRRGGRFILRIEDTDRERSTRGYEEALLDGLRWLGLDWDEGPDVGGDFGPYRQSERGARHLELAERLLSEGLAYRCFCPSERLAALREDQQARKQTPAYDRRCAALPAEESAARAAAGEPFAVRFRVPEGETRFRDRVRGEVVFQNAEVDDWIMVRTGGPPTYNFAATCDDADMGIDLVLRGEEHLVNTPKQVLLYRALGLEPPEFGHLPLMLGADGKKLSKRTGDTALEDYRDRGYPPEAVFNFLCLQGWALDGETEVFSVEELVGSFDPAQVSKGGAVFDLDKFDWLAGEYIRADSPERLAERCLPFLLRAGLASEEELRSRWDWVVRAVASAQERIGLYSELPGKIGYLLAADEEVPFDPKAAKNARKHEGFAELLAEYAEWVGPRLEAGEDPEVLSEATKEWVGERGRKIPALFQPLRCALSGQPGGPDLFEIMGLLGPARVLSRIERGVARLRGGAEG